MNGFALAGACILSLFAFARFNFGGELFVADLIALAILPFALANIRTTTVNLIFLPLGIALILYALMLDSLSGIPQDDMLRAFARNSTVVINFISIGYVMTRWPRAVPFLLPCLGISLIVFSILQPSLVFENSPWKMGLSQGFFLILIGGGILLLDLVPKNRTILAVLFMCSLALLFAYMGSRYDSRTTLFIGLAGAATGLLFSMFRRISPALLLAIFALLLLLVPYYFTIYNALAQAGLFGEDAALRMQIIASSTGADNAFYASRYNTFDAMMAAIEAFPKGMGSFPPGISYHSNVVTAVVETGLIGLLFWLNLFAILGISLWNDFRFISNRYLSLYIMLAFSFFTTVLFDPLQGYNRFMTPLYFTLLMAFLPITTAQFHPKRTRLREKLPQRTAEQPLLNRRAAALRRMGY